MNKDTKKLYMMSFLVFAVLFSLLFINVKNSRIITACVLIPMTIATCLLIRKRSSFSINKKEVLLLTSVLSIMYVILKEMTGLYFSFYKNPYFISPKILLNYVLPLVVIIVLTEILRSVFLAQKNKPVEVISFLSFVIVEILMLMTLSGIRNFNHFMDVVGLTLFPAISANIFYHYTSKRYGMFPNIVSRCIVTIYVYFLPKVSGISDAITACIKVIFPIVMLALVVSLFEKKKKNARQKGKHFGLIGTAAALLVIVSMAMLISCQFRFGAIVVATESMTGEINKGDMVIYEQYDGQPIEEGQVIVFLQNKSRIIHRVVEIEHIGEEVRYYTKGDANEDWDSGYITEADIVGLTDMKLSYFGYPTLWLRELLKGS